MKTLYLLFLTLVSHLAIAQTPFVTRWNLATAGSGATQLSFGIATSGTVSYTWQAVSPGTGSGSGTFTGSTATIKSLPSGAVVDLSISPTNFNRFNINNGTDKNRLTDVRQWGTTAWTSMLGAFRGCSNLQISATDLPDLDAVTSMRTMFESCSVLNGPANIGTWNTTNVTDMGYLFIDAKAFNQNIASWDLGNVTDMNFMFAGASVFNQPIGAWDTGKVTNMASMFSHAFVFNQPIANFNTTNVTNMSSMFYNAWSFNQTIGNWNTGKVTYMSNMFNYARAFNQPIGNWNTSNVTDMRRMFGNSEAFNQPIGNWNTEKVTDMSFMFSYSTAFNQPIGSWNTEKVTDMSFMFENARSFNHPIGSWNTGNVTNMGSMFYSSDTFNQTIGSWNTGNVTDMSSMFLNNDAFNQPIGSWNTGSVTNMSKMFANNGIFNQPIDDWDTGKVNNMGSMFLDNDIFNQPIGSWNTSNVTNMSIMFSDNDIFNQPIGSWNTSNVAYMDYTFSGASAFNQPMGNWNTAKVTGMTYMFSRARSFNQSIGTWTLHPSVNIQGMLRLSGMDCYHYSTTLIGWSDNPATPGGRSLDAQGKAYGANALTARNNLVTNKGWTITGDAASGSDCSSALPVTLVSFSGKKTAKNQNILKWITADEKDFDRFEVQRSGDAKVFETIGVVLGQKVKGAEFNESGILNAYTFTDLTAGTSNYYRLKMRDRAADDKDGSYEYSRIISIPNSAEQAVVGSFYPNPSSEKVFVDVYAVESGSWTLTITDAAGKTMGTQVFDLQKGMNKIEINGSKAGLNLVRFEYRQFSEVRKLIKD